MEYKTDAVLDIQGNAVFNASIRALTKSRQLATVYNASGVQIPNPVSTDKTGEYSLALPNGEYYLEISFNGTLYETRGPVTFFDPKDERTSIKDFGAVGDGVVDDTAAIQAAIDYVQSLRNGGDVFAPAGVYKISASINAVAAKYMRFHGEGKATKFQPATEGFTAFNIEATSGAAYASIFEDFTITKAVTGNGTAMSLTGANVYQINRVRFESSDVGVTMADTYAAEFNNCVFSVPLSEAIKATTSAHNTIIRCCNFYTCGVANNKAAIKFSVATDNIVIDDNDFEYCYRAASFNACTAVSFNSNYVEYCAASDIEFIGANQAFTIQTNWFALGTVPFVLNNVTGIDFRYNRVYNHTVDIGSGITQINAAHTAHSGTGAVNINYLRFESRTLGGSPSLRPSGPDADIQARFSSKGAADVAVYTNNESNLTGVFGHVAGAINWLRFTGSIAGAGCQITAQGGSSDIGINFAPKGTGNTTFLTGSMRLAAIGSGLRVAEGSNAKQGTAALAAGTVTVANTSVTANSRILLTSNVDGGTPGFLRVSARTAGASFTITSSSASDTSTVAYQIFEPA